jgi:hypothetical protein
MYRDSSNIVAVEMVGIGGQPKLSLRWTGSLMYQVGARIMAKLYRLYFYTPFILFFLTLEYIPPVFEPWA